MPDEIIEELWKIKDTIAEEHGCDVRALVAHLKERKRGAGEQTIDLRGMQPDAEQGAKADRQHDGGL